MKDPFGKTDVLKVDCPCCGANLDIDPVKGIVLESREPGTRRKEADLKDARQLLQEESSRIHDRYRQIVEADKGREVAMEKKFKDFLEKTKEEPAPKPLRDIDLD